MKIRKICENPCPIPDCTSTYSLPYLWPRILSRLLPGWPRQETGIELLDLSVIIGLGIVEGGVQHLLAAGSGLECRSNSSAVVPASAMIGAIAVPVNASS